ncbi:glycosyl transferase family protein [Allosphingosinicella humi]
MDIAVWLFTGLALAMREVALFAAFGFLVLGISDVVVDLLWLRLWLTGRLGQEALADSGGISEDGATSGLMAVFVPAWDEAGVIEQMLATALRRFSPGDFRLYVGCYPNDPETIAAVRRVADPRVRLVIGGAPGPTTKADCLNRLWEALREDESREGRRAKAVVLHDAEDVVHSAELAIFDRLIGRFDLVQLPVLPLIDPNSRWIAGHYIDEFAESHAKELVVRAAVGAALPSAGVGCAFARDALERLARRAGGLPFDAESLTEDYELGLRLRAMGGRAAFVRRVAAGSRALVATREYFPGTIDAAVSQKARWMTGIALSGWDRLGWTGGLAERWMRLRDRQSVLAALVLLAGYCALLSWALLEARNILLGVPAPPMPAFLEALLWVNAMLFTWRLAMRFGFVTRAYGWREGLRSLPRVVVGNAIAMLAARRALLRYLKSRRTGHMRWDKTIHAFPSTMPAE